MDGPLLLAVHLPLFINGISQHVEHPAQGPLPYGHRDRAASGSDLHAPGQALAGGQSDAAHRPISQVLKHLQHLRLPAVLHGERVADLGQAAVFKLNVHHRPQDLQHLPLISFHERDPFLYGLGEAAPRLYSPKSPPLRTESEPRRRQRSL